MERKLAEKIIEMIEYVDDEEYPEIYENYSGKFMYGKKTTGIEVSNPNVVFVALGMVLKEQDDLELEGLDNPEIRDFDYKDLRVDNLGLKYIVY